MQEETMEMTAISEAVRVVGDGWTLLILWSALQGVTRFDTFQKRLGLARNILSNRLSRLVESGLLEKRPIHSGARRLEYRLTQRGKALAPVIDELETWGATLREPNGERSRMHG